MRLSVIFDDQLVVVDGRAYKVTLPAEPDIHAIQWSGQSGEIEYRDQYTPNAPFSDEAAVAPYLALWQAAHADATDAGPPPDPVRRLIPKSVVQERVNAIGKLDEILAILMSAPVLFARWFAPDHPNVYYDDARMLQLLESVGCTPEEIAAITAP